MSKLIGRGILAAFAVAASSAIADTAMVSGKTWSFEIEDNAAVIVDIDLDDTAVTPKPVGSLTIPTKLGGKTVAVLGNGALRDCSDMTKVVIPSTVTEISPYAFSGCSLLATVNWPAGLTRIGYFAFENCEKLAKVTIPSGVTEIEQAAFSGCSSIKTLSIPGTVKEIDVDAFYYCVGLTGLTIANGVQTIGETAFAFCESLESVSVPDSVTSIGDRAFQGCISLRSIELPGRFRGSEDRILGYYDEDYLTVTFRGGTAPLSVVFDANGGKFSNGASTKTVSDLASGNLWGKLYMPSRSGYVFVGWYTAKSGGTLVTASSKVPGSSATYYARWTPRLGLAAASEWSGEFTTDSWCGQGAVSHDGVDALRSGIIYNDQSSYIQTRVSGAGTLTFWWKVSSEGGGNDKLGFLVDGEQIHAITGEAGWSKVTVAVDDGSHVFKWCYSKDSSVTKGQDFAWIDQLSWTPSASGGGIAFDANGGKFSNGATVRRVDDAEPGNLWGKLYMPSRSGYVFVGWYTAKSGGTLVTASSKVPGSSATYYARWTPRLGLAAASEWSGAFTTDSWCGQGAVSHDGVDALRSGIIYDDQSSYLQTAVTGAGTLTFWWKVSCEGGGFDRLRFLVDSEQICAITGETGWSKVTVKISGYGTHLLKWVYSKDVSGTKGQDFGWIDQIQWTAK